MDAAAHAATTRLVAIGLVEAGFDAVEGAAAVELERLTLDCASRLLVCLRGARRDAATRYMDSRIV